MQGVTVSWVGQSFALHKCSASKENFALPKCSASKENKSRIRRTKEERRTMVSSFIKKYQSSNNGKFPSLNLTHKEVGGSFYTIREIVRDIIQENKVLGPGNPSSKLLNLEYYSEEEADYSSLLDIDEKMSISAIGNGIDPSMEQQEVSSEENIVINKSDAQVMFKADLNDNSSWKVNNGETSLKEDSAKGSVVHEKMINTGTKESSFHSLTAKKDDAWGNNEQKNSEVQPNSPENIGIQYAKQSLSLYSTMSGNYLVESALKNEDTHHKISVTSHCFEESANLSETSVTESLPETSMRFTDIVGDQSNCGTEHDNHQFLTLVDARLDLNSFSETVVLAVSDTPQISRSAHNVLLPSKHFVEETVIYNSELETVGSNREIASNYSSANKANVPFIPFDKEPFISSAQPREMASSSEQKIDVAEGKSVDNFVLQTTMSPAPGATKNDIPLVDKSSSFVDAMTELENASIRLLEPVIQEADHSDIKSEKQYDAFSSVNGGDFMSSSKEASKESVTFESNPLWAAIKALVSSFIKFWSE